jgi:GTPase Era involved in 16S rRNA processing
MDNTDNLQTNNRKDRHGANNPMWGRHHTAITKQKQSDAATKRYQQYKKAIANQPHLTMDEFLGSQPIRERISEIIREEISKLQ